MRKSKFLKSSKEMLSRSFDSTKCKTSLRLAGARLKLLRNKKEVQMNQMKREIAQLLESGQDHTAQIRVEHVIREEKMITAYELIEIYCELIVARLSMIESQKTCPIDLNEAIASVLFASPRCGDVPELVDVKKHFTAKYGKDFTNAAVELHPDCGVNRMLVEKLSAVAPDRQTKYKILIAIAEEHNVKWDPKSSDEKDSALPSELLTGSSTFLKESEPQVEPPRFPTPDVQVPQSNNMMQSPPLIVSQMDHRTSPGAEKLSSTQTSGASTTFQHEAKPPPADEREQLFQGDSSKISLDKQMWNMEFKDAASAGKAAAEFADRAILAFRAAAELSGHASDVDDMNDKVPVTKLFSEESINSPFSERITLQEEQTDGKNPYNLKTERTFEDDDSSDDVVPSVSGISLKESSKDEMSIMHKAEGHDDESDDFREENIEKRAGVKSSHSQHSGIISDDVNIFSHSDDPSLGFEKEGNLAFDESDSDTDIYGFSVGPTHNDHGPGFHFPSSGPEDHHSVKADSWSPTSKIENPFFTRKNSSEKLDGPKPVTFDESDSESEFSDEKTEMELNFGKLNSGALRHNNYNLLPYLKNKIEDESEDNPRIINSDSLEEEEESLPKESFNRTSHGISQRTKASPSTSVNNSYSNYFDDEMDRKSTTSKTSQASNSTKSNYWGPPENYDSVKATFETTEESKSDEHDSGGKQKPSHVHPKLPDYDTLFQSLHNNRS